MPSTPTSRWQISGYRFMVRRMEHALVRHDVRMLHDPMRSQSRAYTSGFILGCVALAGFAVLALLRPQGNVGDNKILVDRDSGAVYAVVEGVVHPALNLASARLAVGDPAKPVAIKESALSKYPRGALIGIPGAPAAMTFDGSGKSRPWTVCDKTSNDGSRTLTSAVIAGAPALGDRAKPLEQGKALLVGGRDDTFLVWTGRHGAQRARVDMRDPAVLDALQIRGLQPRLVSSGLLNAIPEVPKIVSPKIDSVGDLPTEYLTMADHRIGDVVHVATKDQYYVLLRDGVQQISPFTADLIRGSNRSVVRDSEVSQADITHADQSQALPVADYPTTALPMLDVKEKPVDCLLWTPTATGDKADGSIRADLTVLTGGQWPIPDRAVTVDLAQGDNPGDQRVAKFYSTPGTGMFVQTTGIEPDSQRRDSLFFVADTGVRFGVANADAAKALGMDPEHAKPAPAPWQIVGLLAPGPALSRSAAMVAHDGVAPDPNPARHYVEPSPAQQASAQRN